MQNIELAQISQDIVERFTTAAEYWRCYRANDTQSGMGSMGDAARRRQQWALIVCKPRFDILFRMLKHANVPPFVATFPASQPCDVPDPLPVMRREMKLLLIELSQLRIEVEQLRAREEEAQNVNKFLYRVIENRDEWRREAQRLRVLMAKLPRWLLFCGRCLDALKTSQEASEGLDVHQSPSHCP